MTNRERAYEWLVSEHCNAIRVEDFPGAVESLLSLLENEDEAPPVGSRLWRCEQELGKARARLHVIKSMVTEAPFPPGMYLIDKGHVDVIAKPLPKRAVEDGPSMAGVQRATCGRCLGTGHVVVENAGGYFRQDPCGCGAVPPIGTAQEPK